jgi:FkbM family methyltransferase
MVDCDVGLLELPADDAVVAPWLAAYGTWEEAEADVLRGWLRPGMTMIDVGAHVGYFSVLAAHCVGPRGRVIAVEPDPLNYALLVRNLRARNLRNVATINAAAWDVASPLVLVRSADNSGDHRVRSERDPKLPTVAGLTLDDLIPASWHVDVVKVDTQGTDHRVVLGMTNTLARCRSCLVVEYWPPGIADVDPATVPEVYRGLGYRISALEAVLPPDAPATALVAAAAAAEHGFLTLLLEPADEPT